MRYGINDIKAYRNDRVRETHDVCIDNLDNH